MEFVAIGDLHFDNRLSQYEPLKDINSIVAGELRKVLQYARNNGIKYVFLLGDIADKPVLSDDASIKFIDILHEYSDLRIIMITGNHDREDRNNHSLNVIKRLCKLGMFPHVRVIDEPTVMFVKNRTPINFLPWPHFAVRPDCLNVIHIEFNKAQWESGQLIENERDTECALLGGHLHTHHIVRENQVLPGTLYQVNFGEKAKKFWLHGSWDGLKFEYELIPNKPAFELRTVVITSKDDLDSKVTRDPRVFYRAMIRIGADIDADTLGHYSNIIKTNNFKNKSELQMILAEDLLMNDPDAEVNLMSVVEALETWMLRAGIETGIQARALDMMKRLVPQ